MHAFRAFFVRSRLSGTDLSLANLALSDFRDSSFEDVKAKGSGFWGCRFSDDEPDLKSRPTIQSGPFHPNHATWFIRCNFSHSSFDDSDLSLVLANDTNFTGARFGKARCSGATFVNCTFDGAWFAPANLKYATFINQKKVTMKKARFEGANCTDTSFRSCNLEGANFRFAELKDVEFKNCDLMDADFAYASLEGADLSTVNGLRQEQLLKANTLYGAKLPADLANSAPIVEKVRTKSVSAEPRSGEHD
jgi:uncharacterized protein YjbI with pentapeptide repeats